MHRECAHRSLSTADDVDQQHPTFLQLYFPLIALLVHATELLTETSRRFVCSFVPFPFAHRDRKLLLETVGPRGTVQDAAADEVMIAEG